MVKQKIKLKLSKPEWLATVQIFKETIEKMASSNTSIAEITAMECIIGLFWKMRPRCNSLRQKNNSLSLSLPEAWAITYIEYKYAAGTGTGIYEATTFYGIVDEIHRQAINMQGTLTLEIRD